MMNKLPFTAVLLLTCACCMACSAIPARKVTFATDYPGITKLPTKDQLAWRDYVQRSRDWARVDRDFIEAELKQSPHKEPTVPPAAARFGFNAEQPAEFYKTTAGRRIADIILSFQTPSGGWSKRTDMAQRSRKPAEAFGAETSYIPTFDNKATTTQMRVLALAFQASKKTEYADAFSKGLRLILQAQFPNGGWPQNYPLTGGYHDYITFNDDVMIEILSLLHAVAARKPPFDFVPENLRREAAARLGRGIDCLLETQVISDGGKTAWGAQHDTFTLQPRAARAFEPAALASQESARIVEFLMRIEEPSPEVVAAVDAAAAWFQTTRIMNYRWNFVNGEHASLDSSQGAGPLWARFYEIGGNRPVFGDRDGSVHYDVSKISRERQIKYAWYTEAPAKMLARHEKWKNQLTVVSEQ